MDDVVPKAGVVYAKTSKLIHIFEQNKKSSFSLYITNECGFGSFIKNYKLKWKKNENKIKYIYFLPLQLAVLQQLICGFVK